MATNFALQSKVRDLWININTHHVTYLYEEKSPVKLKYFNILQDYIKEFISIVPHKKKFNFSKTAEILRLSVHAAENFNALNAASAWQDISTYANNLNTQPWRKEYHEIRLYSGFYKHRIEKHLKGAEMMLEIMGYKLIQGNKMILEGPVNSDMLTNTSLDALIAMCECQVLFNIYKEVSKHLPICKWTDILEYREVFVCSVDQAIRGLLSVHQYAGECCPDCVYPYPSYQAECCRKCRVEVPCLHANGYRNYYPNNVPYHAEPLPYMNGHCNHVPTAKLIDIDDSLDRFSAYRKPDHWNYASEHHHKYGDHCISSESNFSPEEDGYRRERLLEDRKDRISRKAPTELDRKSSSSKSNCISDSLSNLKLNSDSAAVQDTVDSGRRRTESAKSKHIFDIPKRKSAESRPRKHSSGSSSSKSAEDKLKNSACDLESPTWACSKCTYYNSTTRDVCEMCSKSKHIGDEIPLISGGKHCRRCTLVNKKEAKKCEACDLNLEGSPTWYI